MELSMSSDEEISFLSDMEIEAAKLLAARNVEENWVKQERDGWVSMNENRLQKLYNFSKL